MAAPYMAPQQKTEAAFLGVLAAAITVEVLHRYGSHTKSQKTEGEEAGEENARELPAYSVKAKDMAEYPKFTGNVRGSVEVTVMTSADPDPDVEGDDPEANHTEHVGLVGDALRPEDTATLEAKLTTAGRAAAADFTCLLAKYMGTTEQKTEGRRFETTHVFQAWVSPSNVS